MSHTCELLANVLENIEEYYHEEYVKYINRWRTKAKRLRYSVLQAIGSVNKAEKI